MIESIDVYLFGRLLPCTAAIALMASAANAATVGGRVLGPDGKGIAEAVVFVQSPIPPSSAGADHPPPAEMSQVDKSFVPGVLPIAAGTRVRFPNRDPIHHHVYSFSRTKSFELPLYRGEEAAPVLFDKPGVVKIGCNIHDWMSAIILVLPSRYFAMTDANGRYTLPGLPAGKYTLAAWHAQSREKTEDLQRPVQLAGTDLVADFEMTLDESRARPARHGARANP